MTEAYSGDAYYEPASTSLVLAIGQSAPTIGVWAIPATTGHVTYHALLAGTSGMPAGDVAVSDGAGGTCTIKLNSRAQGTCEISESAADNPYSVTGTYAGDSSYPSSSADLSEIVRPGQTTISASRGSLSQSGYVTYKAHVRASAGIVPTGAVSVSNGVGGSCTMQLSAGKGSCSFEEAAGTYTVTFAYGGDSNYLAASMSTRKTVS